MSEKEKKTQKQKQKQKNKKGKTKEKSRRKKSANQNYIFFIISANKKINIYLKKRALPIHSFIHFHFSFNTHFFFNIHPSIHNFHTIREIKINLLVHIKNTTKLFSIRI